MTPSLGGGANFELIVRKDGVDVGVVTAIDFIEGSNVTLTPGTNGKVATLTIAATGSGGAPTTADYLVGTAQGGLSAEIVVGTTPGGELGGTWDSPTVDATHAGSAHVTDHGALGGLADDDHAQYRLETEDHTHQSTGAQAGTLDHGLALTGLTDDDHTQYQKESEKGAANGYASLGADALVPQDQLGTGVQDGSKFLRDDGTWQTAGGGVTDADYLVGTAHAGLSAEIVVGTAPGGELGGTWGSPTVDATHSGSAHHAESHGNEDHTSTFITATGVTFENLDANADVGTGATQVSQGSHTHAGAGHTIADAGTPETQRATLDFQDGFIVTDNAGGNSTDVDLDYGTGATQPAAGDHTHAGAGHTIQDDDASLTQRANLSFQDGFVLTDDVGGNQSEVDLSYGATGYPLDVAATEADGTAITVARSDHVHRGTPYITTEPNWRYVATWGSDSNDGYTWATAKLTLENAVDSLPGAAGDESGVVYLGRGTFTVSTTITRTGGNIQIIGQGNGTSGGTPTTIKAANSLNNYIIDFNSGDSGDHGVYIAHLGFDGNRTNQTSGSIMRMGAGFNYEMHNIAFAGAYTWAIYRSGNSMNVQLFNISASNCGDATQGGFLNWENLTGGTFSLDGFQVDNCGKYPFYLVHDAGNDSGQRYIFRNGKVENQTDATKHENVFRFKPRTAGGGNPTTIVVKNVHITNAAAATDAHPAACYEESQAGVGGNWVLEDLYVGAAYQKAFTSAKTSRSSLGRDTLRFFMESDVATYRPMQIDGVVLDTGAGTPEAVVTAPVGSVYYRRDGGAGTCLYIKESGTGNTGWIAYGAFGATGYPVDVDAGAEADGTATTAARSDHKHAHGSTASGDLHPEYRKESESGTFSVTGTILDPAAARNIMVWRAPFACTVTNVRGHLKGATGSDFNARKNQSLNLLAAAVDLPTADVWTDGGAVQNTAFSAGDDLEIMLAVLTGAPTEFSVQVDFTRP